MIRSIVWQRLEPVARTTDLDRSLEARVHDPLWLLARQWQFGELVGEDAGTPLTARLEMSSAPLTRWRPGDSGTPEAYDPDATPLEVQVEREPEGTPGFRLRAEAGRIFTRLLRANGAADALPIVAQAFPLTATSGGPPAPFEPTAPFPPDPALARQLAVVAGRLPDGVALLEALRPGLAASPPRLPPTLALPQRLRGGTLVAALAFADWADAVAVPPSEGCWVGGRFEYRFAVAGHTGEEEVVLAAPEYRGGTLDWHDVVKVPDSLGAAPPVNGPERRVSHVLVTPVRFAGMPADRYWEMEDASVSIPSITAAPEDLARLVLVEFATVFGNDWYVLPVPLRYGTLSRMIALVVRDTFGEDLLVNATTKTTRATAPWRMFAITGDTSGELFLPPVVPDSTEGPPLEEVLFLRDEMANLAWGVERVVEGADGRPRDRTSEYLSSVAVTAEAHSSVAELAYRLSTTVPGHWIPFVAVHESAANRGVRLQRAAMLQLGDGDPVPVQPLGRLLDRTVEPLFVQEEEIPREGARVSRIPALCRWLDGRTHAWTSRRVNAGRGEGQSGLRFDLAFPVEPEAP